MNYLTPIPKQFSDQSGTPYSYGKVYVYVAGTSELANIYKEANSDVLAENPYTLDVAGSWQCFVPVSTPLDYIVTDTDNNTVFSFKNVSVPSDEGSGASVSKAYVDTQDRALGARISNLAADVDDEVARAEAAEKAAKTEVVEGENIRVEETIAPDGHSIFSVSSDGAPQEQSNWTQQDPSEPDYIKNKPTKLSEFTDDITKQSLVESGVGIEKPVSSAAVNAGLSEKADKVQGATAGNLAALDANGNLADSGKKATDFATDEQGAKADTAVQGVKVNGTELSKDGNNKVDVPVPTASTNTPLKDGSASAGSSTQWARGDHVHPTDDSREAIANKVQSIDVESETDYPSSKAVADFVNSSVATNTATFLGNFSLADLGLTYPATEVQIASALNSHTWPTGYPTNNDYVYVEIRNPQSTIDDKVQRYKYRDGLASWGYEYTLNNSSFTAEEKAAIDSGITSQDVTNLRADHTTLGTHVADTNNPHSVTAAQVGAEPAFSVLPISKGGTGKTTGKAATNNLFSDINNVNTDPDDTARIVFKYGSPSDSNGIFFARAITSLWNYIKGKISSVLGLSEDGYTGNAATATSATSATTASNYASGGDIDTALQGKLGTSGDGSNVSVTPDGTSTGTDIGNSTTLKVWAQKFKNLVGSLKALAFKDTADKTDLSQAVQTSLGKADTALQYNSTSQSSGSFPLLVNDSGTGKYNSNITLDIAKAAINATVTKDVAKIVTTSTTFAELVTLRNNGNIIFFYDGQTYDNRSIVLTIPLIRVDWADNTQTTLKAFVFGFVDFTDPSHYGRLYTKTCDKDTGWSSGFAGNDITYSKLLLSQYNAGQTDYDDYGIDACAEYRSATAGLSHAPNSTSLFDVLTFGTNVYNKTQIAFERFSSGNTAKSQAYIRYKTSSGWSGWSTFLYSNGQSDLFTSGSGSYGTHSANDAKSNGVYYCGNQGSLGSGMPACIGQSTSVDGALISLNHDSDWGSQIAQDYRRGDLFVRGRRGSVENADNRGHAATTVGWSDWKQVVTMPVAGSTQQKVGNTSTPVYADSNGQVKPCGFQVNFGTPIAGTNVLNIVT